MNVLQFSYTCAKYEMSRVGTNFLSTYKILLLQVSKYGPIVFWLLHDRDDTEKPLF
jgi:hypothetical protein